MIRYIYSKTARIGRMGRSDGSDGSVRWVGGSIWVGLRDGSVWGPFLGQTRLVSGPTHLYTDTNILYRWENRPTHTYDRYDGYVSSEGRTIARLGLKRFPQIRRIRLRHIVMPQKIEPRTSHFEY
jgi:hypothetical protein